MEVHGEEQQIDPNRDFKFEVVERLEDPLTRQVSEAVRIIQAMDKNIHTDNRGIESVVHSMNRKQEFFAPRERVITT